MLAFPRADDPIARWAQLAPQHVALIDDASGRRVTYAELEGLTDRWAAQLVAADVRAGDRVALLAGTRVECVAAFYGCLRAGAALVPLNWRLSPNELARVLDDAQPSVLILDPRHATLADRTLAQARVQPLIVSLDMRSGASRGPAMPAGAAEDATMILYTSGSTGAPKGVVLPRRQLLYNAIATTVGWRLGPNDVVPVSTPLFHTGGWHVFLTPLLHVGGTVVLFDGFDAERFMAGIAEYACTVAFAVPTQLGMLQATAKWGRPLPSLRHFISGGAPCPPSIRQAVREAGYGMRQGYGLTECGPNCFATTDADAESRPDAVGWPVPYLEARLVDEDGVDVPNGAPGELLLRGPQLFAGYYGSLERTTEALTPDGWLRTGDLARRDADGRYTICGRRKEMYISGGENVYPGEVEAVLCDAPNVLETAVIGVPDAKWGEVGHAFVVARAGCAVDASAIVAFARCSLAAYKVPKYVTVLDALPRLGSGKTDRRALGALVP